MSHNPIRPWRDITRRKSRQIRVGDVLVGGDAPIAVQTMTNTPTEDAAATIAQIQRAAEAGADIVRVSCPTEDATAAMPEICKASPVPIVADIHFHYKRGIEAADAGAACLRINPGNIGSEARVREVVTAARANGCSIRIGVNGGSLERHLLEKYGEPCPDAMVESALDHARILDDLGFHEYKISVKASDMFLTVAAYQQLAEATDAPLHLGITEAGGLRRHDPRVSLRRSGGRSQSRLRNAEVAGPAHARREHCGVPLVRAPGLRRDQDGRDPGTASLAHS